VIPIDDLAGFCYFAVRGSLGADAPRSGSKTAAGDFQLRCISSPNDTKSTQRRNVQCQDR